MSEFSSEKEDVVHNLKLQISLKRGELSEHPFRKGRLSFFDMMFRSDKETGTLEFF